MPCDHVICLVCVTNWIERERTCPLCKQDIPDDFKILSTKSIRYSKVILIQENNLKFRTIHVNRRTFAISWNLLFVAFDWF